MSRGGKGRKKKNPCSNAAGFRYYDIDDHSIECPERHLLVAVLEQALLDACGFCVNMYDGGKAKNLVMNEAIDWIKYQDPLCAKEMSFNSVCEAVNIEPEALRRYFLRIYNLPNERRDNVVKVVFNFRGIKKISKTDGFYDDILRLSQSAVLSHIAA